MLNKLAELYNYPTSDRMPSLLLTGDTNNGKSTILKRYCRQFQPYAHPHTGILQWHVLYITAPEEPDESRLYTKLFDLIGEVPLKRERVGHQQSRLIRILKSLQVKIIIIDEAQHILAGSLIKQRIFLNVIKTLSNELQIPLVCAGMPTAANAVQRDEQLRSRFFPIKLPRWKAGEEYRTLLQSFELLLPLKKPSNLAQEAIAIKILALTEGTIGEISTLLKTAAIDAIKSGRECISLTSLKQVDYLSPSKKFN